MDYIVLESWTKLRHALVKWMQLRPKGANSKAITKGIGKNEVIDTLPFWLLFT